jgi:hypothetical protein
MSDTLLVREAGIVQGQLRRVDGKTIVSCRARALEDPRYLDELVIEFDDGSLLEVNVGASYSMHYLGSDDREGEPLAYGWLRIEGSATA